MEEKMIAAQEPDLSIGVKYYTTDSPGCGGKLRQHPEDFLVEELWEERRYEGGRYLVVAVEKKNWDTHHLIRDLSRRLRISQKRFGWAGTKDKRAVTRQRMSIINLDEKELERVSLPGVKIKVLGRSNRSVALGDLSGNRFQVRIRDLEVGPKEAIRRLDRITAEVEGLGGLPNYFGVQRFGEVRPVTHLVGEALVKGDPKEAVFIYLTMPFPGEPEATRVARSDLQETEDLTRALRDYPHHLRYERAILNHLVEHRGEYASSFDVLSTNLKRLFVHAYQSYLFNMVLSRRMERGLPLDRAVEGDVVCYLKEGIPNPSRTQHVDRNNLDAVNRLASRGRAYVTLPLFGYESQFAEDEPGRVERAVLDEEGMGLEGFRVAANPGLGSKGVRRPALLKLDPQVQVVEGSALLGFTLPPGSYATVVLREYMK
jgi:tRNA pseudouridine synthase, TruD family